MKRRYVWIVLLLVTLYTLYRYDYQKTLVAKLKYFAWNDVFFMPFFASSSLPSSSSASEGNEQTVRLFTQSQLSRYTNLEDGLYLAILGQVYDVTKGERHYGPGGSYQSFVGRDASLAFVTGDFSAKGLTDDVSSLKPSQIKSLSDWTGFYAKDYTYKGKLIGRYYDSDGNPTSQYHMIQEMLALAEKENSSEEQKKRIFPPCNIEWKPDVGTRLWCSKRSGGIERDWIGVPRMLFEPGSEQHRCACVNLKSKEHEMHKGNLREYEGCAKGSTNCVIKNS
ncbi:neuferricin isoform X1 [Neodiprion pinetum]|uniref:neuferricin isoform X1 n=1 Tax=Neodiprion pinetum TaxID=441929 RepID=UPI001EDFC52E|nr:neuferricin isoform X1 [Neodiprion pinetum]